MPVTSQDQGLTFKAYRGEGAALLAFDIDPDLQPDLAGFAVRYRTPEGDEFPLTNRLSFVDPITAETTPAERQAIRTTTDEAPLQKFHWTHFPFRVSPGVFTYTATAMLFKPDAEIELEPGPTASVDINLAEGPHRDFQLAFTRGYLSSQAYADRFDNAPISPADSAPFDFDTTEYLDRYRWLGFGARQLIFDTLDQALDDPDARLDVLAFDLDEPDLIRSLVQLGPRARLFLDDSDSHVVNPGESAAPPEVGARDALTRSAGSGQVRAGHFGALAHDKIFILTRGDGSRRVVSGSANFSVRGLYVQANNVFAFDDAAGESQLVDRYQEMFEASWNEPKEFARGALAAAWHPIAEDGLPAGAVSFAPHHDPAVSLDRVAEAIDEAESSVLFAIMNVGTSTGPVLDRIRTIDQREDLYAFGTTQRLDGAVKARSPTDPESPFVPFGYLHDSVPEPFHSEMSGGSGFSMHHKFVVCDFNGAGPVAFAGSSNLAAGGESSNGDNLVEFRDPAVATSFGVEAIKLIDHYRFRAVQSQATAQEPLRLRGRSENWSGDYFDPDSPRDLERRLFIGT